MTTPVKTTAVDSEWSRRYQSALRRYLKPESVAGLRAAQRLGREAVSLGMETLDVARIHEQTLSTRSCTGGTSRVSSGMDNRARAFFEEAIVPIEQTHGPALRADAHVMKLKQSLRQRTREATESTRLLGKGVERRQVVEAALLKSDRIHAGLLVEARRLRLHLQTLKHEILSAQEDERKTTGSTLRDDIAQLLLAIQIRLLALNGAVRANSDNLKKEIAETRRIVKQSIRTIQRLWPVSEVNHEA